MFSQVNTVTNADNHLSTTANNNKTTQLKSITQNKQSNNDFFSGQSMSNGSLDLMVDTLRQTFAGQNNQVKHNAAEMLASFTDEREANDSTLSTDSQRYLRYPCPMCNKRFAYRSRRKAHMRCHTKERPYKCKFCSMGFTFTSARRCHERLHTGEKPHQCQICHKRFTQIGTLKGHMETHREPHNPIRPKANESRQEQSVDNGDEELIEETAEDNTATNLNLTFSPNNFKKKLAQVSFDMDDTEHINRKTSDEEDHKTF